MEGVQVTQENIKCYLFHGVFQHVSCGMHIVPIHPYALHISQKDNMYDIVLCMYI